MRSAALNKETGTTFKEFCVNQLPCFHSDPHKSTAFNHLLCSVFVEDLWNASGGCFAHWVLAVIFYSEVYSVLQLPITVLCYRSLIVAIIRVCVSWWWNKIDSTHALPRLRNITQVALSKKKLAWLEERDMTGHWRRITGRYCNVYRPVVLHVWQLYIKFKKPFSRRVIAP